MPTYQYECGACGHEFERFQSITAGAIRKCPKCGRLKARRLIGAGAGIIFKGSGFYETDYRSKEYKEKAKKEKDAKSAGSTASKSESKSDSKSDAKKEAKGDSGKPAPSKGSD